MLHIASRSVPLAAAIVVFASCTHSTIDRLEGSGVVGEAPPAQPAITAEPIAPIIGTPVLTAAPVMPELVYFEPLPAPARHSVTATPFPADATSLDTVQRIDVEVSVEAGPVGTREISVVFVSPQRIVWQRQRELIDVTTGAPQRVSFSLPVASTFIHEQQLAGQWQIITFDGDIEEARTSFNLALGAP